MANQEDLATIMTIEQGKPLAESKGEIGYGASFVEWFAEEAKRVYGDIISDRFTDKRILVLKQPVGVVGAITPWNFPSSMITRKCAPALAVGCSVVIKPASQTPYSALALAVLAEEAGFPKGVINIVTGSAKEIGLELTSNANVRKVSFTGSTEVGKILLAQCASTVKKVSMELGGHAPFIAFEDCDINQAVLGAMQSKFRNTGQTCVCANRLFVHEKIYNEFLDKFTKQVSNIKVGNGLDDSVTSGPLIDQYSLEKVEEHVHDAVNIGSKIAIGGKIHSLGGNFYQPTVLYNVTSKAKITYEETFGLVAAEAMLMGVPVIGSNAGGIPEIIQNNINGLLFETKNSNSLKQKISMMINSLELRQKLSNNAKIFIREHYNYGKHFDSLDSFLNEL